MKIMLDLETFGTRPGSVIASIGAVEFDTSTGCLGRSFYRRIDVASAQDVGLTIDGSTVLWWLQQSEAARMEIAVKDSYPLPAVLMEFVQFYLPGSDVEVWGNGAAFDNILLREAYRACGITAPWKFYNDRCYRTVKSMYSHVKAPNMKPVQVLRDIGLVVQQDLPVGGKMDDIKQFPLHHALGDAIFQAVHMLTIYGAKIP